MATRETEKKTGMPHSMTNHRAKGDILFAVLSRLAEGIGDMTFLFYAFMTAGYGASSGKIQYVAEQSRADFKRAIEAFESNQEAVRRYRVLLSGLKCDGLIEERPKKTGRAFVITRKGMEKLATLLARKKRALPSISYETTKSDVVSIVTFDVPERDRRKRNWLRAALRRIGFIPVQKSVLVGKVKLPKEFLEDLRDLHIAEFVEIFQVTKAGSLRHIL